MITFENVEAGYSKSLLTIDKIALERGSVFALIGANGAGKSTLLKSILGQISLLNGVIKIDDVDVSELSISEKSKRIAFVDAHFLGIDYLTVYDYVALGRTPFTNFIGKLDQTDHELIERAIQRMGLHSKSHLFTNQLSDGERQLCAVARAIAQTPHFLLLDEPTAFLDYGNRKLLLETLIEFANEQHVVVLMSSHDIELCVQAKIELLVVHHEHKKLDCLPAGSELSEITALAFP